MLTLLISTKMFICFDHSFLIMTHNLFFFIVYISWFTDSYGGNCTNSMVKFLIAPSAIPNVYLQKCLGETLIVKFFQLVFCMTRRMEICTFKTPDPNFSPLQVLACEIGKHQTDVVMVLIILDTQIYNNYILSPFICVGW